MTTVSETTVFDTFFTATIKNYSKELQKNFLEYWPVVKVFMDDYRHTDSSGGRLYQTSAEYGLNPNTTFFSGAQTFEQEPTQTALPIVFQWRYLGSTVSMTKTEMLENRGKAKLFDIAESRIRQAIRSMNLVLGQELYSDGTNYNGQTIIGLAAMISTTPTADPASGAVGGLSVSSFNWWQNNATTSCGSFAANGVNGTSTDLVVTGFNNASDGGQVPKVILSDQNTFEYYNRKLLQTVRYLDPTKGKGGDLTFESLLYRGIPWMWDRLCPTGRMYMFDPALIHLVVDPEFLFEWSPPLQYPYQLAYTRIVGVRLSACCKSRMFSTVLDGWTA